MKLMSKVNLSELIDSYKKASPEERDAIRGRIDAEMSAQLLTFGHESAVDCVRKKSKAVLLAGLISQSIENAQIDFRDNLTNLFLLYHSAKLIGEDPNLLIKDVIKLSSKEFGKLLYDFLGREDLNNDVPKLAGYKAVDQPQFDYVWMG